MGRYCHHKGAAYTERSRILLPRYVLGFTANESTFHHRTPRTRGILGDGVFILLVDDRHTWLVESVAETFCSGWDLG